MKRSIGTRLGVSVLELLVVLAVIGLLLALALPAILSARDAARKTQCQSRLKSIGLACQAYMAAFECFPIHYYDGGPLVRLLPLLESDAIYDRMNHSSIALGSVFTGASPPRAPIYLPAVICPADASGVSEPRSNYAGTHSDGSWDGGKGIFRWEFVRPALVTDGLSRTVAFSEWLTSPQLRYAPSIRTASYERRSVAIKVASEKPPTREALINECLDASYESATVVVKLGLNWTAYGLGNSVYNHQLTPNTRSCWAGGYSTDRGAFTAASNHSGGVYVAMADGSVQWVSNAIDLAIWRGMATMIGGESAPQ